MNELRESRDIYLRNKDQITLFREESLQQKIMQYYRKSGNTINELGNAQSRLHELERKYNEVRAEISRKQPGLTDENLKRETLNVLSNEYNQYNDIKDRNIPQLLKDISKHSGEAKEITEILDKNKRL